MSRLERLECDKTTTQCVLKHGKGWVKLTEILVPYYSPSEQKHSDRSEVASFSFFFCESSWHGSASAVQWSFHLHV